MGSGLIAPGSDPTADSLHVTAVPMELPAAPKPIAHITVVCPGWPTPAIPPLITVNAGKTSYLDGIVDCQQGFYRWILDNGPDEEGGGDFVVISPGLPRRRVTPWA